MKYDLKIKELREVLLITQQELADLLGVTNITVNRWENNKSNPSLKEKRKLVKMFKENKIEE
ncbi:MAG: helix-turn-helix transcriptional regulator [Erysipelotrichaceae bacterium]